MNMKFMLPIATALLAVSLLQPEKAHSQSRIFDIIMDEAIENHLSEINKNINMIKLMMLAKMTPEERKRLALLIEEEKRQKELFMQKQNEESHEKYSEILQGH